MRVQLPYHGESCTQRGAYSLPTMVVRVQRGAYSLPNMVDSDSYPCDERRYTTVRRQLPRVCQKEENLCAMCFPKGYYRGFPLWLSDRALFSPG